MKKIKPKILILFLIFISFNLNAQIKDIGKFTRIGLSTGPQIFIGDTDLKDCKVKFKLGVYTILNITSILDLELQTGYEQLGMETDIQKTDVKIFPLKQIMRFHIFRSKYGSPFINIGSGAIFYKVNNVDEIFSDAVGILGCGFTAPINDRLSYALTTNFHYSTSDYLDAFNTASGFKEEMADGYLNIQAGISYNIGKRKEKKYKHEFIPAPINHDSIEEAYKNTIDDLNNKLRLAENELDDCKQSLEDEVNKTEIQTAQVESIARKLTIHELYVIAMEQFNSYKYDKSMDYLAEIQERFADHPNVGNATYWTGECYFGKKEYNNAIAEFKKVLKFEKSYKFDDSLTMLGLCYYRIGNKEEARKYFSKLLTEYPKSEYYNRVLRYIEKTK